MGVLGESAGGMVHTLPTSGFTFSKAETATLGLALLVLLAALLLGVILVAALYCLLIRRKARSEEEFESWVCRMQEGKKMQEKEPGGESKSQLAWTSLSMIESNMRERRCRRRNQEASPSPSWLGPL